MFDPIIHDDALCLESPGLRCLSTGWDGGFSMADAIYAFSVPSGWECRDLDGYAERRRGSAGFGEPGPTLFTAVDIVHVRGARLAPVEVYATAGLSNPAALPMRPQSSTPVDEDPHRPGTVNLIVGTDRALDDAAMSNLLCVAAEAKAATLLSETGFTGTTTDAIVCACDPTGKPAAFSGSATAVGAATRACVRDAVLASLRSRYPSGAYPASVDEAEDGVVTDARAAVFSIDPQ